MSTGLEWLTPVAVMPYIGDMELRRAEPPGTSQAPATILCECFAKAGCSIRLFCPSFDLGLSGETTICPYKLTVNPSAV